MGCPEATSAPVPGPLRRPSRAPCLLRRPCPHFVLGGWGRTASEWKRAEGSPASHGLGWSGGHQAALLEPLFSWLSGPCYLGAAVPGPGPPARDAQRFGGPLLFSPAFLPQVAATACTTSHATTGGQHQPSPSRPQGATACGFSTCTSRGHHTWGNHQSLNWVLLQRPVGACSQHPSSQSPVQPASVPYRPPSGPCMHGPRAGPQHLYPRGCL